MKVLEEVETHDGILSVVSRDNMLALRNGNTGYSCIYTDDSIIQPILIPVQKLIASYAKNYPIMDALVLGGGCCTIPRFLIKQFDDSILVDSVEYQSKIIDLTRKYFLNGLITDKLNIIHDDAFSFIQETSKSYDFILVDLFIKDMYSEKSHTEAFLNDLKAHTKAQSLTIFNGYHSSLAHCKELCKIGKSYFDKTFLMVDESGTYYMVFIKGKIDEPTVSQYLLPA